MAPALALRDDALPELIAPHPRGAMCACFGRRGAGRASASTCHASRTAGRTCRREGEVTGPKRPAGFRFTLTVERTIASMEREVRGFYTDETRAHYAARLRFSALIGMIFVPSFFGLDLITWGLLDPDFPLLALGVVRVSSIVLFWLFGRALGKRAYGPSTLLLLDLFIFASVGVFEGGLCLTIGGIGSNYYAGIMLLMMVRAMLVPTSMRRTVGVLLTSWGAWIAIIGVAAVFHEPTRAQFRDRQQLGMFLSNNFFTLTGFGVSVVSAAVMYSLRRSAAQARQIGRYRLIRSLGRGGMGEVYLAEIGALRRPCAVKIIGRSAQVSSVTRQRFQREALETSRLTHPNTIGIFDFGETENGILYYAMEYLDGLDLGEILRLERRLPVARAIHLMAQACASLQDAHSKRIVHRDIKPENFFVTGLSSEPDFLKVLDFGLAKALGGGDAATSDLTADHAVIGTPLYMSPEACNGGTVDTRSDIYSVGAVLYHLLTGTTVHVAETPMGIMVAHLTLPVEPPSVRAAGASIPRDIEGVVMRALARSPEHRFQTMEELRQALSACVVATPWTRADAEGWWSDRASRVRTVHEHRARQTTGQLSFFDRGIVESADGGAPSSAVPDAAQTSMPREATPYSDTMAAPIASVQTSGSDREISAALSELYSAGWLLDVAALRARRPHHILFVCKDNAVASLMAETIARSVAPPGVRISSAGLHPAPANPSTLAVLRESGLSAPTNGPQGLAQVDLGSVDAVIVLTPKPPSVRISSTAARYHWPLPAVPFDSRTHQRALRDELLHRMKVLFA